MNRQLRASELLADEWIRRSVKMSGVDVAMQSVAAHEGRHFASRVRSKSRESMCWARTLGMVVALRYSKGAAVVDDVGLLVLEMPAVTLIESMPAPTPQKALHVMLPPGLWKLVDNEVAETEVPLGVLLSWIAIDYLIRVGRYPPEYTHCKPKPRLRRAIAA